MFQQDYFREDGALQERNNQQVSTVGSEKRLKQFLMSIDEENDSEDEGMEDYVLGGYHPVHIGEVLINRYVVLQKLGWGHFSTVWLCKDFKYNTYVAVKIQKSSPHYMQAAFDEVQILQRVQTDSHRAGSRDETHVVGLLNAFVHKSYYGNHFCMVFQILRCNLLEIVKRYNYEGLPLDLCQQISRQVLKGLDFLHRVCGVIHTDLKPENVMVCLSDQEVKDLVENGQLSSNQLFAERMEIMKKMMGISIKGTVINKNQKIKDIENKLTSEHLSKKQKKNLKKKLRKEKEKQNEDQKQTNQTEQNDSTVRDEIEDMKMDDLFDIKKGKIKFNRGGQLQKPFRIKIADLGNACWKHHHFSTQIQTRQYRSPEVILGQSYNQTSDIWSLGCMMYEMLTGDLLFQPKKTQGWSKNDDHLAQIQELIGSFHPHFIARSPKRNKYFDKNGTMKRMPALCHYPLSIVLQIKNRLNQEEAEAFGRFLEMSLIAEPQVRASAKKMLQSEWLKRKIPLNYRMTMEEYNILKQKFNQNEDEFQLPSKRALPEQPESPICLTEEQADQSQEYAKYADIRLVDRSFTDLGYLGYSNGIELCDLDCQGNWQFV